MMNKKHPQVPETLSSWAQDEYSKWLYWKEEGNQPAHDENVEDDLHRTLYDKEFRKVALDTWSRKQYIDFRKRIMEITFKTAYYAEVINWLARWNALFEYR